MKWIKEHLKVALGIFSFGGAIIGFLLNTYLDVLSVNLLKEDVVEIKEDYKDFRKSFDNFRLVLMNMKVKDNPITIAREIK